MDTDTDMLVVLCASLLDSPHSEEAILDALVQYDGNPEAAARSLNSNQVSKKQPGKKRRRVDLDSWLRPSPSKKTKDDVVEPPETPVASTSRLPAGVLPQPPVSPLPLDASSSRLPVKQVTNLMLVLRQPNMEKTKLPKLPPLMLSTPALVAQHTPCTLHASVLPPELACKLFYSMVEASRGWGRNKWWLFERLVESPHRTAFFARKTNGIDEDTSWQEAARFWYNGRMTDIPPVFSAEMEEACSIVERVVNEEMSKRDRFPLEWAGGIGNDPNWRANVAASNCYEGSKESVGFHSDHLTYLGPYTTIASLSLGTRRVFSLREVIPSEESTSRRARTFNVPLPHNSLTIMHASCQERFKHAIPPQTGGLDMYRPAYPKSPGGTIEPSNCRINITFRFYRPDFRPATTPRCKCDVPTVLRPDMKNWVDGKTDRYWWTCHGGAQNEGKGCNFWQPLDMAAEGRGPVVADRVATSS
ncbi:hypothetical protein B0H17DRAFT_1043693 [Mycena rosella]|uniref:Fe2OG dioxygenase domain-containing protein n=1 Tax=Mycena rosella TaxID=1033263 RepID=A0AAD7GN13_MYCRO|nr:hypothetical protein B0H17DRAFT_1043693 [Mycena rosella]